MRPALILLLIGLTWVPLQAEIGLTRVTVHEYEDGPPVPRGQVFSPGETVFLSFQLSGFQTKTDENEDLQISLAYTIEAADPTGRPITDPKSGKVETRILPED